MAYGSKTLNAIKNPFDINIRLIIMNAHVLSHLHYSSIILNSITQNLVASLDQQLNWAIKSCFNQRKFDSSRDLKIQYRVLPIRYYLDFKLLYYFWRLSQKLLPAFKTVPRPTFTLSGKKLENWIVKSDIELPFSKISKIV